LNFLSSFILLSVFAGVPVRAADPPAPINPLKMFGRSPFSAEFELYSGGITGDSVGAAYESATRGDFGVRFSFGFLKGVNFNLDYMYSNQSRSFTAVPPPSPLLPTGTLLMRSGNLNVAFGSGEFYLIQRKQAKFYISPGIGFARNASRSMTFITPLGAASASSPIFPGMALTFNLGAGVKVYPFKHLGFRLDVRDHVSGGGTGNLNASAPSPSPAAPCPPNCVNLNSVQQYFGKIPVQNNLVFTLGLIFRIR
jgi:hypothetical protein